MDTKDIGSVPAAGISRREFVTAGAAAAAVMAAPTILGANNKSGTQLPIMGEGEYVFEVQHDWGQDSLPAGLRYGNTHNVVVDQHGYVYIHHTVHPDSTIGDTVVVFDPKGRFVRSFGQMFRNSAHGMHIQ